MRRGTSWLGGAVAVALAAGLLAAAPAAQGSAGDTGPQPRRFVTGWVPYWLPSSVSGVVDHASVFDEVSPFWFNASSATAISIQGSESDLMAAVADLKAAGVPVVPTVTASMSADDFAALLSSPRRRAAHVAALVALAAQYGVAGLDLDYENVNFGSSAAKATVLARYPMLAQELETALQADGRLLSVTVPARRSDTDPNWAVYDYAGLGAAADRLRVMTYDYSWSGGPAGPIAPRHWVDHVLTYATSRVDPLKVSVGVPVYGRDWFVGTASGTCSSSARASVSRTTAQMQELAAARGISPRWDAATGSRTFTYRQRYSGCVAKREVWYDDARSLAVKLRLVTRHQIRGVALWAFGGETPGYWRRMQAYAQDHPVGTAEVTMTAPSRITYGGGGVVRGVVTVGGTVAPGLDVRLLRKPEGATRWIGSGSAVSNARGRVSLDVSPSRHTQYRLVVPRSWSASAAAGAASTTRVSYAVTLGDPVKARSDGTAYLLVGRVGPELAGVRVTKQVLRNGTWVDRTSKTVAADGTFRFQAGPTRSVARTYRVVAQAGTLDAGVSPSVRIRFG